MLAGRPHGGRIRADPLTSARPMCSGSSSRDSACLATHARFSFALIAAQPAGRGFRAARRSLRSSRRGSECAGTSGILPIWAERSCSLPSGTPGAAPGWVCPPCLAPQRPQHGPSPRASPQLEHPPPACGCPTPTNAARPPASSMTPSNLRSFSSQLVANETLVLILRIQFDVVVSWLCNRQPIIFYNPCRLP